MAASTSRPRADRPSRGVSDWPDRSVADLFDAHGLAGIVEEPLPTDGWSGATFTRLDSGGRRFVVKRTSAVRDWIVRATRDDGLREAWLAGRIGPDRAWLGSAAGRLATPYLGSAADDADGGGAILMPDLRRELDAWDRDAGGVALTVAANDRLVEAIAELHALPWSEILTAEGTGVGGPPPPWCPLPERLTLLTPVSATGYAAAGERVATVFLRGWESFGRRAPRAAQDLVARLADDPGPLVRALERLPSAGLHGDVKLANAALFDGGRVGFIDWQMTLRAPVAVELGWFLVTNSAELPLPPDLTLRRYHEAMARAVGQWWFGPRRHDVDGLIGDWAAQVDFAMIVGLLLRGWRKGMDAEAGATLGSGIRAADDLAWWSERAVAAADRRL
jgi:Phosphotransferase enzyme family